MNAPKLLLVVLMSATVINTQAQLMGGLKTNLVYDATTTFNLGIEIPVARHHTIDLSANLNPWTFSGNKKIKHWLVQPEWRYWTSEVFRGSFWALHAHTAQYNVNLGNTHRYQGWFLGAGIGYGYQWRIAPHWHMEAELGVGYAYIDYDKFDCADCGQKLLSDIIGTEEWEQMKVDVTKGGAKIIELRGRSSFQSPSYLSVEMIRAAMGGEPFRFPVGTYVKTDKYDHIMMAMKTTMTAEGAKFEVPQGTPEENAKLDQSYEHLCKMRDELVTLNIVPPISEWSKINPNL